ncbi:Synaptobrevin-1 [Arthrobotrys entomopaga]|nr:Synaptobrevin-1 [Arthrobotrys entomopaga]
MADQGSRTAQIQAQIDDTIGVMKNNLMETTKRGQNLNQLQDKTNSLTTASGDFNRKAKGVRQKMWWKNMKMTLCITSGIIILVLIIVVPLVVTKGG